MTQAVLTSAGKLSSISVAILAGGLGTRLRTVIADRPKVLAEIHGRPFIAYLFDQLERAGFRLVTLCTGYLGEQVREMFGGSYGTLQLSYSQEEESRGTAGALGLALPNLTSDPVLVMNGDSFCSADLPAFYRWYDHRRAKAGMLLTPVAESGRYGSVKIGQDDRVIEFAEKKIGTGPQWINAGVYLLSQQVLGSIPLDKNTSLEHDVFPSLVGRGLYGYRNGERFLDIGVPEDFRTAEDFFA